MKNHAKMSFIVYLCIGITLLILGILSFIYSILNPELTRMQIFLKFWFFYLMAGMFSIGWVILLKVFIKKKK